MVDNDNRTRELSEDIEKLFRKAGLTETDVTEAIATIRTLQEVTPIGNGQQYRAYEERYHKMMQDAGFVGQKRSWEEYMDYVRTPAGKLALTLFNRMAEWKKQKAVPWSLQMGTPDQYRELAARCRRKLRQKSLRRSCEKWLRAWSEVAEEPATKAAQPSEVLRIIRNGMPILDPKSGTDPNISCLDIWLLPPVPTCRTLF